MAHSGDVCAVGVGAGDGGAGERSRAVTGEIVSVGIGGIGGKGGVYRAGAWVPVQVRLKNRSGQQLVGRLGVDGQLDLDGDRAASIGPKIILQPNDVDGRLAWMYYWPRPDDLELRGSSRSSCSISPGSSR